MRKPRLLILGGIFFMQKKPYKDYSGIKIDNLTFTKRVDEFVKTKWLLVCECGNEVIRRPDHVLNNNNFKSCGCFEKNQRSKKGVINHAINKIYGSYLYGAKKRIKQSYNKKLSLLRN